VAAKPKLAVFKFASCDGCQLSLLDCEDELLAVVGEIQVANFLEASREVVKGPYDLTLVEGSITTSHDAERIQQVRKQSRFLVTIGACATAGGIQALRNFKDVREFTSAVYATPEYISTLDASTPISQHVRVDFELRGCPISKAQLVEVLGAFLRGRRPNIPTYSVCLECKRRGTVCVMTAHGAPCLGPVTQAGCGAICPSYQGFLRGRHYTEPPDITARICGICPVAYQMSACHALEAACGVTVDGPCASCGACCTAASGSRATRCTSTCCTRPTSSATPAASTWRRTTARSSSRACA
jgi:sulfhydrogenase subunit delta